MGYPMAGHLARAGHRVRVYNRTETTTRKWIEEFAKHSPQHAATPAEAAHGADVVFVCAGNDDDLREVVLGEGEGIVDKFEAQVRAADPLIGQIEALEMGRL